VIAVVLHRLRPFLLQKESSNFLSICNLLHKRLDHPALRASIAYFRELFDGRSFQALMTARSATLVLNSLETFMKWVNAFEYHRDPELRQEIEDAHTIVPLESTKGMMVYMMIEMCKAIGGIGELLNAMKEGKGTEVQLTRKAPRAGEGDVKKAEAGPTAGT